MNSESQRIADQLRRAFTGEPWHGPPLRTLLDKVTAEQAFAHPIPAVHSIWELVVHIEIYVAIAREAVQGTPMPKLYGTEQDWPAVTDGTAAAWAGVAEHLFQSAGQLADTIHSFPDERLHETVPGRTYDFYYLFHGIVQHSLYHAGQIAMLKHSLSALPLK